MTITTETILKAANAAGIPIIQTETDGLWFSTDPNAPNYPHKRFHPLTDDYTNAMIRRGAEIAVRWCDPDVGSHRVVEAVAWLRYPNASTTMPDLTKPDNSCEVIYLYRRKGLQYFVTCDEARFEELSTKPSLFETKKVFAYKKPPKAQTLHAYVYAAVGDTGGYYFREKANRDNFLRQFPASSPVTPVNFPLADGPRRQLTRVEKDEIFLSAESAMERDSNLSWRLALVDATEAKMLGIS